MRYLLVTVLLLHGIIHMMGFSKAFALSNIQAISTGISKIAGICWMLASLLLLTGALMLALQHRLWWLPALAGVLCSQALIISAWSDARWGSIANLLILLAVLPAGAEWNFARRFNADAAAIFRGKKPETPALVQEADLALLPLPVQRYLRYTGCVGKPRTTQLRVRFKGQMREKGSPFFDFSSEQVNDLEHPARLFFMRATVKGLPTTGYHRYVGGHASMTIRALSAIPVVQSAGGELDQAETVTFFNDLCILAPAALLDMRISWTTINNQSAKASFTHRKTTISALLLFNEQGELVNFISDDRYALTQGKLERHRFSTPLGNYRWFGGYRLASRGEAVWHYPDGLFTYGKFELQSVAYNAAAKQ